MSELIDTTEMYLRTVYELEEEGIAPLRARIAERIGHSGPTVSQTVARMERDGLLVVRPDRSLELTPTGRAAAVRVMRKHRLAECLLLDVIGLPWDEVHEEACRWEHVMSDAVELRLVELLDHPQTSPFGNPIPGLGELAGLGESAGPAGTAADGSDQEQPWRPLTDAVAAAPTATVHVLRIGEQVQHDRMLMNKLHAGGVRPGTQVTVRQLAAGYELTAVGQAAVDEPVVLPAWAAELIMVAG